MIKLSLSRQLIILLSASPESQNASIALKLANKVVDKGYLVRIFLYSEAVGISRVNDPRFKDLLEKLISRGVEVGVCAQCAIARGYIDSNLRAREINEKVAIIGFSDLAAWLKSSNKVLSIG